MRCIVMFITAVCLIFLLKLKWPKNKSVYDMAETVRLQPKTEELNNTLTSFFSGSFLYREKGRERTLGERLQYPR